MHAMQNCPRLRKHANIGQTRARSVRVFARAATTEAQTATPTYSTLPRTVDDMVAGAASSVQAALAAGERRQLVDLINPVNAKAMNFWAIEELDFPVSNFKEFETLVGVTKQLLAAVAPGQDIVLQRRDEGGLDGDLCATLTAGGGSGREVVAVVWPTAEKLKLLKQLAEDGEIALLLVVNPLWKLEGNLVSELGVGPWRKANEEFLATFSRSYQLLEQRVGAPGSVNLAKGARYESGAVLRLLRDSTQPEEYQVFVCAGDGQNQAIGCIPAAPGLLARPTYKQLEALVQQARDARLDIFQAAQAASSLDLEARGGGVVAAATQKLDEEAPAGPAGFYSKEQIEAMDPKQLRRLLGALGLPTSGTPSKYQARALAVLAGLEAGSDLDAAVAAARKVR